MAKTKFLSKVLAVLMALSMLCSTGVFADYDVSTSYGDVTVTGTITMGGTKLNGEVAFWGASTAEIAKWFDVNDGLTLTLNGTTDATTGTITYVVAPVEVLEQEPLDVAKMEAESVAIGTADIANGKFNFKIEADPTKLEKNTTYELRLAYSKTEIADVTDASALVYQRYFKSFDWADATTKATRVINKEGIGDITIDIESNPIRDAAITAKVTNAAQRANAIASPTHIRSANLKSGDVFNYSNSGYIPADFKWAGEDVQAVTTATQRQSMVVEVGEALQGGVMLALPTAEVERYYGEGVTQRDNAAYRFKATNSGTVYLLGSGTPNHSAWTAVEEGAGAVEGYYNHGTNNYLYTSAEVTAEMIGGELTTASLSAYLKANTALAVQTPDAPGWYQGGKSGTSYAPTSTKYNAANTAYVTSDGYFQLPAANLDADGNWKLKVDKPYSMGAVTLYNYTTGRGYLTQARTFAYTYMREFEAGEWVEIPYDSAAGGSAKNAAVLQFDIPVAPLASATVTTAKTQFEIDALPMMSETEVAFDGENYVIEVPRGTNTASFTVTNANGATSEAVNVTMDANEKVVEAVIGDAEYDITVKFDDEYPSIYAFNYGKQYGSANRITIQYGDLNTDSALKFTAKATNVTSGVPLSGVAFANGVEKPAADKNLVVIGTPSANSGMSHMTTSTFKWMYDTTNNGTTFKVSAPATVYAKSVAFGNVVWPTIEALGWEVVGTFNGYNLYAKHFNAGETVQIPTQPITQAELDAKNATLTNGTMYAYITAENQSLIKATATPGAVGDVILWKHTDGVITESSPIASGDNAGRSNFYVRPGAADTAFYAVFDSPLTFAGATYSVDGGDAKAIDFAGGTTATVELPYNATSVSVAATKTGTGTVTVEPAELDLTGAQSGTVTITLTPVSGEATVYTVNFTKGAVKLYWESAIAPTGTLKTQNQGITNSLYKDGLYKVGAQSGSVELPTDGTTVNLTVPYGVEVVKMGAVSVNLLDAENHAASAAVTVEGVEYTVNVSWTAYEHKAGMPLLYDLEYFVDGKTALYATDRYYAIPTALVLDADHDLVLGQGTLLGTKADGSDRETITLTRKEGEWFTTQSHNNVNLSSTNNGNQVNRLHLAPTAFESWVTNGDLDDKYALNGATILVADYTDVVENNAVRYKFKTAVDGYVIVASNKANTALTKANGWTRLEGNTMQFTNASTTAHGNQLKQPPIIDGVAHVNVATSFAEWSGACDYIYIKKVDANEVVEIVESTVTSQYPPVVIVATEDMINERIAAPTVLSSLSYTTALISDSLNADAKGANAREGKSVHTGGFYQPTLVTQAATVEVAEDATTVTVTVPYGTEIVNLAGVDNHENPVVFDEAINLINNNGAVTVTKTVGDVEYTINVVWAAYDASADAAGNHIYDVKYRINNLANTNYYNIVPTKLAFAENRITVQNADLYADAEGATLKMEAGTWYAPSDVDGAASNLLTLGASGGDVSRGRATIGSFAPWVEAGILTASGVPGAALVKGEEETDEAFNARVDAITYAALNGATALVAPYNSFASATAANGVNATMASTYSFKVAQDSIVYVNTTSSSIGEGWTLASNNTYLDLHNRTNGAFYKETEEGTFVKVANYCTGGYTNAGKNVYYRYASAGDEVTLTPSANNGNIPPIIIVRPIDFSAFEAPELETLTYKVGSGEATAVEFAEGETTATVTVPWGTTDEISVAASIAGVGNVAISDAITLSKENREGVITVTITPVIGDAEPEVYTINFAWGAAPVVESVSYTTARGIYNVATVKDAVVEDTDATITVPWGTTSVTVSYKLEGADAVALAAVNFVDGSAAVEVELPEGTITLTFKYGAAPAGQNISGFTKNGNWTDRVLISYGDIDDAYTAANTGYVGTGTTFFGDYDKVPTSIAQAGNIVVIADAGANYGQPHMSKNNFPYMYGSYPATEAGNAWMYFTVEKAGTIYFAPASRDEAWAEGEALGWTEAPFHMTWGDGTRKLYQKKVAAGELVLMPNNQVTADEIAAYNATLDDVEYIQVTAEQAQAIEDAAIAIHGEGVNTNAVVEGDWIAFYTDEYLAKNPETVNYAGAKLSKVDGKEIEIVHYTRGNATVLFAVADEFVTAEAKAPKYTGATTLAADGAIELSATSAIYGENLAEEFTFAIKSGDEYATLEGNVLTAIRANYVEGAAVVIEITQGNLTSEVTIDIAPVDTTKYGYLTILESLGSGSVTGELDGEVVIEDTTDGAMEFDIGAIVTLTATPFEGHAFAYWAVVNGETSSVYSREAELELRVPYGITLQAVFKADAADSATVTFLGYQDAVITTYDIAAIVGDVLVTPSAPEVFGHKFVEYRASNWGTQYGEGVELSKTLFDQDITFRAVYAPDDTMEYTLTVVNGIIKKTNLNEGSVPYNTDVVVVANAAEEGMKFSHWIDGNGQIISYDAEYKFYMAAADRTVEAVYVSEDAEDKFGAVITMTVTEVGEDANGPIFGLYAERRVPEGFTVVENGIVYGYAGNNYGLTDESDYVTLENYTNMSTSKYQNNNGQYTVRIQMTEARQNRGGNWYASTYLIYRDASGELWTIYSPKALVWEKAAVIE